jgi:hypothetical protein
LTIVAGSRKLNGEVEAMRPGTNPTPPARPWEILTVKDHGPRQHYRYSVTGVNHHRAPPERFSWSVPNLDDPQYDLSHATHL